MGLFELDKVDLNGIEVKKTTNKIFKPIKSFCFPERQSNEKSSYVDEYGQIHRKNPNKNSSINGAYVDEYGQIVRPSNSGSGSSITPSSTNTSGSSSSTNYSYNDDSWKTFWRVVGTIMVIGLVIAISAGTNGYGTPIAAGGYYVLRAIWKDN